MSYKYSVKIEEKDAPAQLKDRNISYKDASQVCRNIRGKAVKEAQKILEECASIKTPIRYYKFKRGIGHRSQLGGKQGRFPVKECKEILRLLKEAVANASHKGLDEAALYVKHAAAYKQNTFLRYRKKWLGAGTLGYGRFAMWANYVTARVELVVSERRIQKEEKEIKKKEQEEEKEQKEREEMKEGSKTKRKREKKAVEEEQKREETKVMEKKEEKIKEPKAIKKKEQKGENKKKKEQKKEKAKEAENKVAGDKTDDEKPKKKKEKAVKGEGEEGNKNLRGV